MATLLDQHDLKYFTDEFSAMADPELVLLKGHLMVERILFAALAARLDQSGDARGPRVGFGALIELAVRTESDRKPLRIFNDIRNALAHELRGADSPRFETAIKHLTLVWPTGKDDRLDIARLVVHAMVSRAFMHYLYETFEQNRREPESSYSLDLEDIEREDEQIHDLRRQIEEIESQFTTH